MHLKLHARLPRPAHSKKQAAGRVIRPGCPTLAQTDLELLLSQYKQMEPSDRRHCQLPELQWGVEPAYKQSDRRSMFIKQSWLTPL
jgi:hypothetical protein